MGNPKTIEQVIVDEVYQISHKISVKIWLDVIWLR